MFAFFAQQGLPWCATSIEDKNIVIDGRKNEKQHVFTSYDIQILSIKLARHHSHTRFHQTPNSNKNVRRIIDFIDAYIVVEVQSSVLAFFRKTALWPKADFRWFVSQLK